MAETAGLSEENIAEYKEAFALLVLASTSVVVEDTNKLLQDGTLRVAIDKEIERRGMWYRRIDQQQSMRLYCTIGCEMRGSFVLFLSH